MYDRDFAEWAQRDAELLRSRRVAEADLEYIAERMKVWRNAKATLCHSRLVRLQPLLSDVAAGPYEDAARSRRL